jgi:hypothetical protein
MEETKLHRLRVGDRVEYRDENHDESTGDLWTGTIAAITNDEATYVQVEFDNGASRELTEEEVRRVP